MPEREHDDDPFRKVQEDLKDLDFGSVDRDSELTDRVNKLRNTLGDGEAEEDELSPFGALQAKVSEAAATPGPSTDDFEASLRRLEEKASTTRKRRETERLATDEEQKALRSNARGLGTGLTIAYIIVGVPMVGALIGWVFDMQMGTNIGKGIGCLTGAVIGIGMAMYLLNRPSSKP